MEDGKEKDTTGQVIKEEDDFEFGKKDEGEGSGDSGKEGAGSEGKEDEGAGEGAGSEKSGEAGEGAKGSGEGAKAGEGSGEAAADEGGEKGSAEGSKADKAGSAEGKAGEGEGGEAGEAGGEKGSEGGEAGGEKGSEGDEAGKDGKEKVVSDFFGEDFKEGEGGSEEKVGLDVKAMATEFEIEAETPEEFKTKITEKIEGAKQEFKLDKYSADAQSIIKHLNENEGKIEDFFTNKNIASLQSVIGLGNEEKVLYVRTGELTDKGMNAEEARTQASEEVQELGTRELKDIADKIDTDAKGLISKEVESIVGEREKLASKQRLTKETSVKKEVDNLVSFVNSQENFMGIEMTPKAKENIVREIESGKFDEIANQSPAESKFAAYMISRYGKKIVSSFLNNASEQNRKGYNAAVDKATGALHKNKAVAQGKKTGHDADGSEGEGKNFQSWVDESMFDEDAEE